MTSYYVSLFSDTEFVYTTSQFQRRRSGLGCARDVTVVMDRLTRYPEVAVVSGTGGEENKEALQEIFSRQGNPTVMYSDNGPPFNSGEHSDFQEFLREEGIKHIPNVSGEDPEANGLAEGFMKVIGKV